MDMNAATVVAYTYQSEMLCPRCTIEALAANQNVMGPMSNVHAEDYLEHIASMLEIDRMDEHTFDSGDFPKVIFGTQVEPCFENCSACLAGLTDACSDMACYHCGERVT